MSVRASREALVATAGETIGAGSKSFALASRLFDRTTRERAWLLYAWCRRCDDLADGQMLGGELQPISDPSSPNEVEGGTEARIVRPSISLGEDGLGEEQTDGGNKDDLADGQMLGSSLYPVSPPNPSSPSEVEGDTEDGIVRPPTSLGEDALGDQAATLALIRTRTAAALSGETTGDPAFDSLGLVVAETGIPQSFIDAHIEGFALDARDWRPRTEADLITYCWHVAGVVGCMMAVVMAVKPTDFDTLDKARDLGLAFQLANIARDIEEDDRGGRCYLPLDWLVEMDIPPGEQLKPQYRPRLAVLARRLATMAEGYEASARIGARALPFRARWAVLAAAGIYGDIAREVARRGEKAWDRRVVTTRAAKLAWIARALVEART